MADNGTAALAVDVKIASRMPQATFGGLNCLRIASKHGTGQAELCGRVNHRKQLLVLLIGVDVDRQDRAEEFRLHQLVCRVRGLEDGRRYEPAFALVRVTSCQELNFRIFLGLVDDCLELVPRPLVDDGSDEVVNLFRRANLELASLFQKCLLKFRPDRFSHIQTRSSRALLPLILESTPDSVHHSITHISTTVDKVEVLAARLADNAGVTLISPLRDGLSHLAVQLTEHISGSGEMEGCELGVLEDGRGDGLGFAWDELDDIGWKACLEENLVEEVA